MSDAGPIGEGNGSGAKLWPFRPGTALLASILLLGASIAALVALREADGLPDDRISAWLLLGAVLFSLVPVFLSVLDRVAAGAGTVETPGGVKISFAAVERVARVEVATTTISGNLGGTPGVSVADTAGSTILQALKPVLGNEVAVLNLGEGREWWQTRLLLLVAGAARLGQPRALVFTATVSGRHDQLLGWATPRELLRAHLGTANPRLQLAYRRAQAQAGQWTLGIPTGPNGNSVTLPWQSSPPGTAPASMAPLGTPPPELVPEQFLLTELATCEPPAPDVLPDLAVTVPVLQGLFTAVLRRDSVERNDSDEKWRDAILGGADEYLAVSERGTYVTLVSRPAAINAVLRSVLPAADASTSAQQTKP